MVMSFMAIEFLFTAFNQSIEVFMLKKTMISKKKRKLPRKNVVGIQIKPRSCLT